MLGAHERLSWPAYLQLRHQHSAVEQPDEDMTQAILARQRAETLSSVLYPDDRTYQGKELRLKQQHFFVSATMQVGPGMCLMVQARDKLHSIRLTPSMQLQHRCC